MPRGRPQRSIKRDDIFFAALSINGVVGDACEQAGYARRSVYEYRAADPEFRARWEEALERSTERLEASAVVRAMQGVESYVLSQGKVVTIEVEQEIIDPFTKKPMRDEEGNVLTRKVKVPLTERKYSDTLTIFLLKARRPELYRDRYEVRNLNREDKTAQDLSDEELERIIRERGNADQ